MTKSLSLVLLLFMVFGCTTVSDCPQVPTAAVPETKINGTQSENLPLHTNTKPETKLQKVEVRDRKQPSSDTLSAQEIRRVQALLKTAGFDPGHIDGAFGPKTKNALLRLRSSCSDLNDLMQGAALDRIAPTIISSTGDHSGAAKTTRRKEEIRVIQVRLKDAGFNPGQVDGVAGPNTQAAVARFRSGCGALETMPPAVFELAASIRQGDRGGSTAAGHGMTAGAVPSGDAARSKSSRASGTTTNALSALETRRQQIPAKDLGSSPVSLGEYRGGKPETAPRPRDETGANRVSSTRSSSAVPMTQY